jgi:hypothetical protein
VGGDQVSPPTHPRRLGYALFVHLGTEALEGAFARYVAEAEREGASPVEILEAWAGAMSLWGGPLRLLRDALVNGGPLPQADASPRFAALLEMARRKARTS